MYNLISKRFVVSRDAIFKEDIFPFQKMITRQLPLFPNSSLDKYQDDDHKELSEKMNDMETIIPQEQTFREINMHNDSAWNEGNEDVGDIDMINEGAEKNVDISVPDIIT